MKGDRFIALPFICDSCGQVFQQTVDGETPISMLEPMIVGLERAHGHGPIRTVMLPAPAAAPEGTKP